MYLCIYVFIKLLASFDGGDIHQESWSWGGYVFMYLCRRTPGGPWRWVNVFLFLFNVGIYGCGVRGVRGECVCVCVSGRGTLSCPGAWVRGARGGKGEFFLHVCMWCVCGGGGLLPLGPAALRPCFCCASGLSRAE